MYLTDILICSQKYVQILSNIATIKSLVFMKGIYKNMLTRNNKYTESKLNLRVNQDNSKSIFYNISYELQVQNTDTIVLQNPVTKCTNA